MAKNNTAEALRNIREALGAGDHERAWHEIEPILRFPDSQACTPDELAATWAFFQKVCPTIGYDSLVPLIAAARVEQDDPATLLILGQGLIDHGLHAIAATPLSHASQLVDDNGALAVDVHQTLNIALPQARTPLMS